jgi:heme-degrading monooxygenase HmoA
MAASPWKQFEAMEPGREYLVLASFLPLKRMAATPKMLGLASSVRRQLKDTPGVVGYSLDAKVFAKEYFTLSIWDDDAALQAFVQHVPHVEVMSKLAGDMDQTKFVTWTITGADARPTWAEAKQRLG